MTESIEYDDTETVSDQSDLLDLLQNLERLVLNYMTSARTNSKKMLLTLLADEAEVLTRKARRMHQRWSVYLPFHEVIDVNFEDWANDIDEWLPVLKVTESTLTNGFLLDLVREEPVEELKGELKSVVPEVCAKIDKNLREDLTGWEHRVYPTDEERNPDELKEEWTVLAKKTENQLIELRNELKGLEEFFSSELKEDQFKVLALRLRYRDCADAVNSATREVTKAHNSWPERFVKERARKMKEDIKLHLLQDKKLAELPDYIDLEDPELYDEACFGQFLFKNRHKLETEDVQEMVKQLETIILLNEKYIDPNGSQRKRVKVALGRELNEEEKQIVKRMLAFAEKVEWRGGATSDSIKMGINRMLGVGYQLDKDMQPLSENLWKLLKSRKNCDADKSFKVTWFNIVGWCVRQRFLTGGSPALCKIFYSKYGPDDYKAIDKGRTDPPVAFQKIEPLLEKFLK